MASGQKDLSAIGLFLELLEARSTHDDRFENRSPSRNLHFRNRAIEYSFAMRLCAVFRFGSSAEATRAARGGSVPQVTGESQMAVAFMVISWAA